MKKSKLTEIAAAGSTGAGSIAAVPGGGTANIRRRDIRAGDREWHRDAVNNRDSKGKHLELSPEARKKLEDLKNKKKKKKGLRGFIADKTKRLFRISEAFEMTDVVSRLKGAEDMGHAGGTITYGVEDDDGNIMKVTVAAEQAEEFEARLSQELAEILDYNKNAMSIDGVDSNRETSKSQSKNISMAELLFNLRREYDIIDVEFPTIPVDGIYNADKVSYKTPETGDPDFASEEGAGDDMDDGMGMGDAPGAEGGEEDDMGLDDSALDDELSDDESEDFPDVGIEDETSEQSVLSKVIDMMKADAEAKIAQANAEAEKAKAAQAEYQAKAATATVQQQEELMRMEAKMEEQKKKEKEAKKLADLAKFRVSQTSESSTFPLLGSLLREYDEYDTVQTLNRQRIMLRQKFRPDPTDSVEDAARKKEDMRDAMRELEARVRRARRKESAEKDDKNRNKLDDRADQDDRALPSTQSQPTTAQRVQALRAQTAR